MSTNRASDLQAIKDTADTLVGSLADLLGDGCAETPSLRLWLTGNSEADTVILASWIHAFSRESARSALDFVQRSNDPIAGAEFRELFVTLRTYFQHHLASSGDDSPKRTRAEEWFGALGVGERGSDNWHFAFDALAESSQSVLNLFSTIVHSLLTNDDQSTRQAWEAYQSRIVDASRADPIVRRIANELGLASLDVAAFRRKHLGDWQRGLKLAMAHTSSDTYLAQIIQRDLLDFSTNAPMPLDGVAVMDAFGLAPGPMVRIALKAAQEVWESSTAKPTPDELLERVATTQGYEWFRSV